MVKTDLVKRVAFSWPETDTGYVLVQLDFPDTNSNSGSLFSCQLSIDDMTPNDDWQSTDLQQRIGTGSGLGVVGTISLPRNRVDREPLVSLRFLSLFGLITNIVNHSTIHFTINANVRCTSTERQGGRIWLVKAEILSGGFVFDDGGIFSDSFIKLIWPANITEPFRGIFFTGSELQIEVGKVDAIRRFRLLGVDRNDTGDAQRAVWEHVESRTLLSELGGEVIRFPNGNIFEDHRRARQPIEGLEASFQQVGKQCTALNIAVTRPDGALGGSPIVVVSGMDTSTSAAREFTRIDWTVAFDTNAGFAERTLWQPRTLSRKDGKFVLSDVDEVERALQGDEAATLPIVATWGKTGGIVPTLPLTRFVGTADQGGSAPPRDLWFQAKSSVFPELPASWAHINAPTAPADPARDAATEARLSGPIRINVGPTDAPWTTTITPAAGPGTAARLTLTLPAAGVGKAELAFARPNVAVESPAINFYTEALNDPKSVPNEREPHLSSRNRVDKLLFVHRPESAGERPTVAAAGGPEPHLLCAYTKGSFEVRHATAAELYLPAEHALVDPVSVTRGNLVGRQSVSFPLVEIPNASFVQIRHTMGTTNETKNTIVESALDLTGKLTDLTNVTNAFTGFFLQLSPPDGSDRAVVVARIRSHTLGTDATTVVVDPGPQLVGLATDVIYALAVGPTRLSLPRDVNHGLVRIAVSNFGIVAGTDGVPMLKIDVKSIRADAAQSVFALHPWTEWGPTKNNGTKTGLARLHHRNLIQEHDEFESSFEDRFPPDGPQPDPATGQIPSPLLPLGDFVRAVRDRYTEASGNVLDGTAASRAVTNWLPHTTAKAEVSFDLSGSLPVTTLTNDNVFGKQSLKLRKANDADAELHWLDTSVRVNSVKVGAVTDVTLEKTDASDVTSRRALDSHVPLLFNRHDVSALASAALPGDGNRAVVIVGGGNQPAVGYLYSDPGTVLGNTGQLFEGKPLRDIGLTQHGGVLRGLVITDDGSLKRFRVSVTGNTITLNDVAVIDIPGARTVACAAFDASAKCAVLSDSVLWVNAESGVTSNVPGSTGATAVAMHFADETYRVAFGKSDGSVVVRSETGVTTLPARPPKGDSIAKPIRSLRFILDGGLTRVVACDGTPYVSTWGFDTDEKKCVIVQQPADALVIVQSTVADIDGRGSENVSFFGIGLRSGEVRISAALRTKLAEIRVFDAAAPITKLHLSTAKANETALCLAGTSAGTTLGWNLRQGNDWPAEAFPCQQPQTVMDALGVVREVPASGKLPNLVVDRLSQATHEYRSISTDNYRLSNPLPDKADGNFTEFILKADAFKVKKADGTVEPRTFPDGDFSPGTCFCTSTITAEDQTTTLAAFDHWPRLDGVPFFVETIRKIVVVDETGELKEVELIGILLNPDEVAAGQDDADALTKPGAVIRALSRANRIVLKFTRTGTEWTTSIVSGTVDWPMAVNRPTVGNGVPGAVARVVGNAELDAEGRLSVAVGLAVSHALVFGRLWPFQGEPIQLRARSVFTSIGKSWLQSGFEFVSSEKNRLLHIDSQSAPPTANLPVNLQVEANTALRLRKLTAQLGENHRVTFDCDIGGTNYTAHHNLQQGDTECFMLAKKNEKAADLHGVLLLSAAGDLSAKPGDFDPTVGPRRLVAVLAEIKQSTTKRNVAITVGVTPSKQVSATVLQSTLTVHRRENTSAGDATDPAETQIAVVGSLHVELELDPAKIKEGKDKKEAEKEKDAKDDQGGKHDVPPPVAALTLLLEGTSSGTKGMSGLLVYSLKGVAILQSLIRCEITLSNANEVTALKFIDDVFWCQAVTTNKGIGEATILFDQPGTVGAGYRVLPMDESRDGTSGFFKLGLAGGNDLRLKLYSVPPGAVPLMPELEPSRLQAPNRLGENNVRLIHRRGAGLVLRPDMPTVRWGRVAATASNTDQEPTIEKKLVLEPVVVVGGANGPLTRLRQDGWLERVMDSGNEHLRTDGLFVLNADSAVAGFEAVSGLEARTQGSEIQVDPEQERLRTRDVLRTTNAQGIAIRYMIQTGQDAEIGFVDSPFYEHAGSIEAVSVGTSIVVAVEQSVIAAPLQMAVAVTELPGLSDRYVLADLPADLNADVCCLAHRGYRLMRKKLQSHVADITPILHVAEVPAFREPARLMSPSSHAWHATGGDFIRPFFPRRLDWELAADKPGAMFQMFAQARITDGVGNSRREPQIDFALREPQFIAIKGCVTAAVAWESETRLKPVGNRFDATLVWTETVATVPITADATIVSFVRSADGSLKLPTAPLQLVVEFNGEGFAVQPADAAVPAYRIEAQAQKGSNDTKAPQVRTKPAATYLVSKIPFDQIAAPVAFASGAGEFQVAKVDGFWTVPADIAIVSGTEYTFTGFADPALNARHRLVAFAGRLNLMQDTADGMLTHAVGSKLSVKLGDAAEARQATVVSRRPFCLRVEGARPEDGTKVVMTEGDGIRGVQTGATNPPLHIAQTGVGNECIVVTPTVAAGTGGDGRGSAVHAEVVPYFEAAVRRKLKIAVDTARTFETAFRIAATPGFAAGDFVRVAEVKFPQVLGVFRLLEESTGMTLFLARPSVGKPATATTQGTAGAFLATDSKPVPLAKVVGGMPITIELSADKVWPTGTAVAVSGLSDVPEANGIWIVRGTGDAKTFELYEPPAAGTMPDTLKEIDAVVSVVTRLGDAFERSLSIPRLRYDPQWDAKDRPQLQLLWAGRTAFAAADGTGIAWRVGGALVELYEQPKQIKFLAPSLLAAKLAFVLTAKLDSVVKFQRTILFGDAPPASKAEARIDGTTFILEIKNNREALSIKMPSSATKFTSVLHVVKSLPSGALVYDAKTIPAQT